MREQSKKLSFAVRLLWAVSFVVSNVSASVISNTTKIHEGIFRFHYDNQFTSPCSTIVLLGVGTTMAVEDYDFVAVQIAKASPSVVAGIIDHDPGNPLKLSVRRYVKLVNTIAARIDDLVPFCTRNEPTAQSHPRPPKFILGGHSASGGAAMKSLSHVEGFSPMGFIGLSPFRITDNMNRITIPALFWGFSTTTCGVSIGHAADKAYELSSPDTGRVLYQLQNPNGAPSHCIFANNGCAPVCPSSASESFAWVRAAVGDSVSRFLQAIKTRNFTRDSLELSYAKHESLSMFVNTDKILESEEVFQWHSPT